MGDVTFKTTIEGLLAIDKAIATISQHKPPNISAKIVLSVCADLGDNIGATLKKALKSQNLFEAKKEYKIKLKFHEAYALMQLIIRVINAHSFEELQTVKLNEIKDIIHQKIM